MGEDKEKMYDIARERCMDFLAEMVVKYSPMIQTITANDVLKYFPPKKKTV